MSAIESAEVEIATVPIENIKRDPELQCRASGVNRRTVNEYRESLRNGATFPAVIIFRDSKGTLYLADGWHRVAAFELEKLAELSAEIRPGSRKDALLFAAGCNADNGLRRSPADKRTAVTKVLAEATWAKRADNWIAKHTNTSHTFVAKMRATCNVSSEATRETVDGREMDTSAIGKSTNSDDAVLTKLVQRLTKIVAQCPDTKRDELRTKIGTLFEAK